MTFEYTRKQGQYLAFIYYYTKLNGQPPAEHEMARASVRLDLVTPANFSS